MKEIRLWKIENSKENIGLEKIENVTGTDTEKLLEEIITQHPHMLLEDLQLIGRQTDTPSGPLDLLGVDADGNLIIFELKRGTLTREAVSQIIDYSSFLASLDSRELGDHISSRSGNLGIEKIDDFSSWYQDQFGRNFSDMQRPKMVLVGLGVDEKTKRIVSFLSESDLDISLTTFQGFKKGNDFFLSKQVEISSRVLSSTGISKQHNLEKLKKNVKRCGVEDYFYDVASFFRNQFSAAYEWPNQGGFAYSLPEFTESGRSSNRVYVSLYLQENKLRSVRVYMHKRALETIPKEFEEFKNRISTKIHLNKDGAYDLWIKSSEHWNELKPHFETLCPAILKGWESKLEQQRNDEFDAVIATDENGNSDQ